MSTSGDELPFTTRMKLLFSDAFQFDSASFMHPLLLTIVSCIAVIGSVCQIIGLNFWLQIDSRGPFTTAAVVAIFWDIILFIILAIWAIRLAMKNGLNRFDFLWDSSVMLQLFIIGALEAAGTLSVSYSALGTMESLQSMIKATVVPATAIFSVLVMRFDPGVTSKIDQLKAMCRWESITAVVLILAAVAMLAFGGHDEHHTSSSSNSTAKNNSKDDEKHSSWLPWICFLGALFNAFHFVLQGNFMDVHTLEQRPLFGDEKSLMMNYSRYEDNNNQDDIIDDTLEGGGGAAGSHENTLRQSATGGSPRNDQNSNSNAMMATYGNSITSGHTEDYSSVPIIESGLNNRLSVNVVGGRDNTVAGALLHHHSSAASNYSDGINDDLPEDQIAMMKGINNNGKSYSPSSHGGNIKRSPFAVRSDDFTVKISMLTVDTFFQIIFTFMCLPLDAIPGFGSHENVTDAWNAFSTDFNGIFQNEPHLSTNYFMLFLFGFCSSHLAFAYLNHYSPTYTPMVMILASPITNILLLISPSWNAHDSSPVVWSSVISALLMIVAAVLFARYEVGRKKRKLESMQRF